MKLNYKRTFFIGLAFLSISAFWQLYDNIVPLVLKNTFGFEEAVTGTIMALDNVLAIFLLPFFGNLSDHTKTKLGKRTPYIAIGTVIASFAMVLIPTANQQKNLVMFIIALAVALLAMGSYRSPAVALMPDLTPKPLRSKANAIINLMGAVGGIYALIMIRVLVPKEEHPNYLPLYLSVLTIMVLAVVLLILIIRENKIAEEVEAQNLELEQLTQSVSEGYSVKQDERGSLESKVSNNGTESRGIQAEQAQDQVASTYATSSADDQHDMVPEVRKSFHFLLVSIFLWFTAYNAVTTAFSRYAQEIWGLQGGSFANCLMVAMGAAIVSFIPIGILSSKLGRKKTILIGILLMTVSYFFGCFFLEYSPLIYLVFVFTGIGWAAISVNSYPMVVEMSKSSNIGKYTGIYYTFSMAAQIFTPIFSGILLDINYHTLFPYAVVFSFASFLTMLFVKHGDSIPLKKKSVIENYDVED